MPTITDTDTTQADFQEGSLIDVEADAGGYLRLVKLFPDTDLYLPEVSASGTVPTAAATFGPVDCTGLTKQNAYLSIELKCSNWSDLSGITQIEITSSGTWDVEEWGYNPTSLDITSSYKTFLLPLSDFGTAGGELVVSEIDYIRFYAYFNTTQTISWRNAKIIGRLGPGTRISPQLDLSAVGMVESSSVSWTQTLNGGTITIETRVSTDDGTTWTPWSTCTNGGSIPNLTPSTQVVNALLECRQNLSTADPVYSPQLETLNITVEGIGMTLFQSFNF